VRRRWKGGDKVAEKERRHHMLEWKRGRNTIFPLLARLDVQINDWRWWRRGGRKENSID